MADLKYEDLDRHIQDDVLEEFAQYEIYTACETEIQRLKEIIDWKNELLRGWLSAVGHYKILPTWILSGTKRTLPHGRQTE